MLRNLVEVRIDIKRLKITMWIRKTNAKMCINQSVIITEYKNNKSENLCQDDYRH